MKILPLFQKNNDYSKTNSNSDKKIRLVEIMKKISSHPFLGETKIFLDFISIKDEEEFNNFKNNNYKFPTSSKEIEVESGRIAYNCGLISSDCIYKDNESKKLIFEEKEKLLKKLTKEYKLLNLQLEEIISKMKKIDNIWDELYKLNNKLYKKDKDITSLLYIKMKEIMKVWSKLEENHIYLNNIGLREYYRYQRYEYKSFNDYFDIITDKKQIFESYKNTSYFNLFNFFKKPTEEEIIEHRDMFANYLKTFINECERLKYENDIMDKENLLNIIKEIIDNFDNLKSDLINSLNELKEIKPNDDKIFIY